MKETIITTVETIYHFKDVEFGRQKCHIHCVSVRTPGVGMATHYYITGYNPMPIKGTFESSQQILFQWMENQGFKLYGDKVIIVTRETV